MNVEFYTEDAIAAKHFPPLPASQVLPDWFKDLQKYIVDPKVMEAKDYHMYHNKIPQTVKGCLPFMDYMTAGYVIRAASDMAITPEVSTGETRGWCWSSQGVAVGSHPHAQCPIEIGGIKHEYLKLINPWTVKTPDGYSCLFYQPEFLLRDKVRLFPGVVDTDVFESPVSFPGALVANDTVVIQAGAPLMVVFPFLRHSWTHSVHVKPLQVTAATRLFQRGYQTFFHKRKKYT